MEAVKALEMNAQLWLVALLVLVLCGTFKSSAEKFDFEENLEFEERWSRDRRDLSAFQTQLNAALTLDITNTTACPTLPCVSNVNKAWCPAICTSNPISFQQIASSLISCYFAGICGRNFASIQFTNVNISTASWGYNGKCYLYGPQLTMRLINQTNAVTPQGPAVAYSINQQIYYAFEGLTLYCRPHLPCPTCVTCCGSDLLTQVVCLVQGLVGSLGLNLNLLSCNCHCAGRALRERRASAGNTALQIPVTQYERFNLFAPYQNGVTSVSLANAYVKTSVSFASPLPSANAMDITFGILKPFDALSTYRTIQYQFYSVISQMLRDFSSNYCPSCS